MLSSLRGPSMIWLFATVGCPHRSGLRLHRVKVQRLPLKEFQETCRLMESLERLKHSSEIGVPTATIWTSPRFEGRTSARSLVRIHALRSSLQMVPTYGLRWHGKPSCRSIHTTSYIQA